MEYILIPLISIVASIIAALIIANGAVEAAKKGAEMSAKASRESVREMLEGQEQRDKDRQEEVVQAVLQAFCEELYVIYKRLDSRAVESIWEEFEDQTRETICFDGLFSVPSDYLAIYRANANVIGQINKPPSLRGEIVRNYMLLQLVMEDYRTNNTLLNQYEETKNNKIIPRLKRDAKTIRENHNRFKKSVEGFFETLEKECNIKPSGKDST